MAQVGLARYRRMFLRQRVHSFRAAAGRLGGGSARRRIYPWRGIKGGERLVPVAVSMRRLEPAGDQSGRPECNREFFFHGFGAICFIADGIAPTVNEELVDGDAQVRLTRSRSAHLNTLALGEEIVVSTSVLTNESEWGPWLRLQGRPPVDLGSTVPPCHGAHGGHLGRN